MSAQAEKLELEELDKTLLKKNEPKPLGKYERIIQPYVAELVGTTFFVFIGCVSVIENVEAPGGLQPATCAWIGSGCAGGMYGRNQVRILFFFLSLSFF